MDFALLLVPVIGAIAVLAVRTDRVRPLLLLATGAAHLGVTIAVLAGAATSTGGDWLWLDPPGRIVLGLVSLLFFGCAVYAVGYLRAREGRPNRVFVACLCALLASITLAVLARHLGLMWVAIEASALAAAPLIYFNHNARSIEATWKYLLVGSVGVALALLGTFFLAYSAIRSGATTSLRFDDLAAAGPQLSTPWLKAAFVLLLVGYGTKMGLAPMHTWKPDAYGEAPGLAGALLAGGVTSAAFLAILRVLRICHAAGEGPFANRLLVLMGLVSMGVAGALMVGQKDFKRMLAYSSVEHMGILALGVGLGGAAATGAWFHLLYNGLTKGALFLAAGNIHRAFGSKDVGRLRGAARVLPVSGPVFLAAFLAITGSPPFAPFFSEFAIIAGAVEAGAWVSVTVFLLGLAVIFVGMGAIVLRIVQGAPPEDLEPVTFGDSLLTAGPPLALLLLVLLLGLWVPSPLRALVEGAALLGGR